MIWSLWVSLSIPTFANANTPEVKKRVAQALNQRASALVKQGNKMDAKLLFQESLDVSPTTPSANVARKGLLELNPKPPEAMSLKPPASPPSQGKENPAQKGPRRSPLNPYKDARVETKEVSKPKNTSLKGRKTLQDPYQGAPRKRAPRNPYE